MNGLSLFSGIGGLDLAFEWAGGNILAMCEINPYCQAVLRKHWPNTPIYSDIHELSKEVIANEKIFTNQQLTLLEDFLVSPSAWQ